MIAATRLQATARGGSARRMRIVAKADAAAARERAAAAIQATYRGRSARREPEELEAALGPDAWQRGKVVAQYDREPAWPAERWMPYQVRLDGTEGEPIVDPREFTNRIAAVMEAALGQETWTDNREKPDV